MPTENHAKVRVLLNSGRAEVVRRCPFTIRLLYECGNHVQEVSLGVDAGSKTVGLSATTERKVLFESEVELRNDIVDLISTRRELRRGRRHRKTRYRKPRFDNRRRPDGWLAPSVENKIGTHLAAVRRVMQILPVSKVIVKVASFDIQKIENPEISGEDYQNGDQLGFWNTREYVLWRDGHTCQCCGGKSKDKILNVHHIESRRTGGNAPNNLVTLCESCHRGYHAGTVQLPKSIKRGASFRDAAFMGIMRWAFYGRLKETAGVPVSLTYGYITKNTRIANGLPKSHCVDARCISGNPLARSPREMFYQKKVRCHNRQIHKMNPKKGVRRRNQAPYEVMGFRLFDKVRWKGQTCFIFSRRSTGRMDLRLLDGTKVNASVGCKHLKLLEMRKNILVDIRKEDKAVPPTGLPMGFPA